MRSPPCTTHYALIKNNTVANIAVADAAWAGTIAPEWDAVLPLDDDGTAVAIGWTWSEDAGFAPPPAPPAPEPAPAPEARRISVGAFFDRFGPLKWAILADTAPMTQALIKDCSVRKFIDLDDPQLMMGLQMLVQAGHAIDPAAVLGAPVTDAERAA